MKKKKKTLNVIIILVEDSLVTCGDFNIPFCTKMLFSG